MGRARRHVAGNVVAYAALGLAISAAGGVAYSAIPTGEGVISACYSSSTGALRLTDPQDAVPRPCQSGETPLSWNQRGAQGPAGPPGATGGSEIPPAGLDLIRHPSRSKTKAPSALSPAVVKGLSGPTEPESTAYSTYRNGAFLLPDGGVWTRVARLALPAGRWVISAKTTVEPGFDGATTGYAFCTLRAGNDSDDFLHRSYATVSGQVVHRFTKPGAVELRCADVGYTTYVTQTKLTAIRVASLHNKAAS